MIYDRRGYAGSGGARRAAGLDDHAADLLAVIARFAAGRATVVGHSFGSNVAMLAATVAPDAITSLGVWEPSVPWTDWTAPEIRDGVAAMASAPDPELLVRAVYRRMLGRPFWDSLGDLARADRCADGWALRADMQSELTAPFAFADIRVPVVVGYGCETWAYQIPSARHLAEVLGSEVVGVPGADHFAHANHPVEFATFVRRAVRLGAASPEGGLSEAG